MANLDRLPARVNITLDVFTDGAQQKKELPMKLLLLGDFSKSKDKVAPSLRQKFSISKTDYQAVLSHLKPCIQISVPAISGNPGAFEKIQLSFETMQDFRPESIIAQSPSLKKLAAMRHLLKELRADMIDNFEFKRKLQQLLHNKASVVACQQELEAICNGKP